MRILVVEDEVRLARTLARGLSEEGHAVDLCDTAEQADEQLDTLDYDLVLLDWMLPDQDGLSLLRQWREAGRTLPVLMLTARGSVPERVAGLRAGADDFLPKPFDFEELSARVAALGRRGALATELCAGDVRLDVRGRQMVVGSTRLELTPREFSVLERLLERRGEVLTRTELLRSVWGPSFVGEPNVVDVYVGYLRKKLAAAGAVQVSIRTVRGVGFRLSTEEGPT